MDNNQETWIIFHADDRNADGWENRMLPDGGLTGILSEKWDWSKNRKIPQPGYRFSVFAELETDDPSHRIGGSTHKRTGDWVVTRVECYPASFPDCSKREIVLCYCKYEPIEPKWEKLPPAQIPTGYEAKLAGTSGE